jgi:predicted nucleic acid-binding Zn ribbon protein
MAFTPLGDALHQKMNTNSPLKKQTEAADAVIIAQQVMEEIFGPDAAKNAKPLFLKNRTMTISCTSSSIAQEIRLNQTQIVEKINAKLGKKEVDRIRYLS